MPDSFYFLCLGVVFVAAITAPICFAMLTGIGTPSGRTAFTLGVSIALGTLCSLPFGNTHELPWLPYVAVPYFVAGGTGCAFWALFRR